MNGLKGSAAELVNFVGTGFAPLKKGCDVAIFPPATLLGYVDAPCKQYGIGLGGQDCSFEEKGAFTGDISPVMLNDAGCGYVLLGHSERRTHHEETSITVKKKAEAAQRNGLVTVICVGETLEQKENGQTLAVIREQLIESLPKITTNDSCIIAYEPVWAIGTGKTPTAEEIQQTHEFIHETVIKQFEKPFRILYGGSVKAVNARELLKIQYVGGLLVGGASLNKEEFLNIIEGAVENTVSC